MKTIRLFIISTSTTLGLWMAAAYITTLQPAPYQVEEQVESTPDRDMAQGKSEARKMPKTFTVAQSQ
ncbi:hypothetical protein JIN77_05230 [Verrucomicrobiaceae bacterium R5-34]|uniref:Uncharacterized protein n=1 Tax=Oceaniferula flava TaxID=2800421 RepID=A0AAE2SAU9_9BACT|nr:hypothetical protein [Oceaniferula flavus]MBK1830113.1 hypothetical protein [Verrucomicrobiaceae bacterium R5-34]MBK1855018.1 hypothetical protein [Oceaniferula flavus]MBM1136324.1 hypothetical protein [Oceaniferula flavus]